MKHILNSLIIFLLATLAGTDAAMAQTPVMTWDFETVRNGSAD